MIKLKLPKKEIITLIIFSLLIAFLSLYPVNLIKDTIDNGVMGASIKAILISGGIYLSMHISHALVRYFYNKYISKKTIKQSEEIRKTVYKEILNLKKNITNKEISMSRMLSGTIDDIKVIEDNYYNQATSIILSIIELSIGLYLMISISVELTLIMFPITFFVTFATKKNSKRYMNKLKNSKNCYDSLWKKFLDTIRGKDVIQINNLQDEFNESFLKTNQEYSKNFYDSQLIRHKILRFNSIFFMSLIGITLTVGSILVKNDYITIGGLVSLLMYNSLLTDPVFTGVEVYLNSKKIKLSKNRLNEVLQEGVISNTKIKEIEKFKNKINIKNINLSIDNKEILKNITIEINEGEKIAIVGETGSGKSSLFYSMLGLYDSIGDITYSKDLLLNDDNLSTIRENISVVLQNSYVFNDTIYNNITFNKEVSNNKFNEIIKISKLEEFIKNQSEGVDANIGEFNNIISGGERTRINLARALVRDKGIIMFDELTSSLDNFTANEIINNLLEFKEKTMIFIEHRLEFIKNVDKIYFMKNGEIIEEGTHLELININGDYFKLWNKRQFN